METCREQQRNHSPRYPRYRFTIRWSKHFSVISFFLQPPAVQRGAHEAGLDAQLQPDRVDIEIRAAMSSVVKYNHCGQQFPEDDRRRGALSMRSACEYGIGVWRELRDLVHREGSVEGLSMPLKWLSALSSRHQATY